MSCYKNSIKNTKQFKIFNIPSHTQGPINHKPQKLVSITHQQPKLKNQVHPRHIESTPPPPQTPTLRKHLFVSQVPLTTDKPQTTTLCYRVPSGTPSKAETSRNHLHGVGIEGLWTQAVGSYLPLFTSGNLQRKWAFPWTSQLSGTSARTPGDDRSEME